MSNNKNTIIKEGRKPISSKSKLSEFAYDDMFGNNLACDPDLKRDLDEAGLIPRWVDAKRMYEMNGHNDKNWRIYRRTQKPSDTMNALDFKFGNDPTGVIRRGSLVLAVKSKEEATRHREFLNQRTKQQTQAAHQAGEGLRRFASQAGVNVEVHEGYEENEAPGI